MTILEKLSFSDKTRAAMLTSPEAKLRGKMLEAIDLQIEAAKATLNGEAFIRKVMRWVDDPETGERVRKEVPVRFRPWYWKDEQGTFTRHNDSTQLASDLEAFEIMRIVSSPRLAHSTPQCLVDFQKGLERSSWGCPARC